MSCEDCKYVVMVTERQPPAFVCHRFPPNGPLDHAYRFKPALFPVVLATSWCGEYLPKKITLETVEKSAKAASDLGFPEPLKKRGRPKKIV